MSVIYIYAGSTGFMSVLIDLPAQTRNPAIAESSLQFHPFGVVQKFVVFTSFRKKLREAIQNEFAEIQNYLVYTIVLVALIKFTSTNLGLFFY